MPSWLLRFRFVLIAVVALLVFQTLRTRICERYRVPSPSMEPTLHGDEAVGDLVLVDLTAWWWHDPQPFDLVVVKKPASSAADPLVKRLIALAADAPCAVAIRDGDVFVGPDASALTRLEKDPARHRDLRIPVLRFPGHPGGERVEAMWAGVELTAPEIHLPPAAADLPALAALLEGGAQLARRTAEPAQMFVPGHLRSLHPLDVSYLDSAGRRHGVGRGFDRDLGLEVDLVAGAGCTAVQIVFEYHDQYFALQLEARGRGKITGPDGNELTSFAAPAFGAGQVLRLVFGHLDGWFFAEVDGNVLARVPHELPAAQGKARYPGTSFENLLHCGCAGGPCRVRRLLAFRDLHYAPPPIAWTAEAEPWEVRQGEMFLLGDNTYDSDDSRQRSRRSGPQFAIADLLGRPVAILAPRARAGWLER